MESPRSLRAGLIVSLLCAASCYWIGRRHGRAEAIHPLGVQNSSALARAFPSTYSASQPASTQAIGCALKLTITTDTQFPVVGEKITFTEAVTNRCETPVYVSFRDIRRDMAQIVYYGSDEKIESIDNLKYIDEKPSPTALIYDPDPIWGGDGAKGGFPGADFMSSHVAHPITRSSRDTISYSITFSKPGVYRLRATWISGGYPVDDERMWSGSVESDYFEIHVRPAK